jgi:hypothetical protein
MGAARRGLARVGWPFTLPAAAGNLVRMAKLRAIAGCAPQPCPARKAPDGGLAHGQQPAAAAACCPAPAPDRS